MTPSVWLHAALLAGATAQAAPLQAAVVCTGPGYPPGCVEVEA